MDFFYITADVVDAETFTVNEAANQGSATLFLTSLHCDTLFLLSLHSDTLFSISLYSSTVVFLFVWDVYIFLHFLQFFNEGCE